MANIVKISTAVKQYRVLRSVGHTTYYERPGKLEKSGGTGSKGAERPEIDGKSGGKDLK